MDEQDDIFVIDDFLQNPDALRRAALTAEFPPSAATATYSGRNTRQRFPLPGLDDVIGKITGTTVVPGGPETSHMQFRLALANERGIANVHIDNGHWTGVQYMTLDEHASGGTDFFRHRATGTLRAPVYAEDWAAWGGRTIDQLWKEVVIPHTNDPSQWDVVRHVPMKFNRLVLFRPWQWHNATPGFGSTVADGRLIYLMVYHDQS
jgi:hypothetical protein